MKVPVVWVSYHDGTPARGYWDQGIIERLLQGKLWKPVTGHTFASEDEWTEGMADGAVVVLPARHHANDVERLNQDFSRLPWVLLLLTGDEEHVFPVDQLKHPRMLVYEMTPRRDSTADRYLPNGYPLHALDHLSGYGIAAHQRDYDWFFSGQVTHERRRACVEQLRSMKEGDGSSVLVETEGFTQGLKPTEYFHFMASAKIVPCPSGPVTPDTFRLYEALEAGCLPIADDRTPQDEAASGYWRQLFGFEDDLPFPIINDWSDLPGLMRYHLDVWPSSANRASAWWQGYKRQLTYRIHDDISQLAGGETESPRSTLLDRVTVLIPSSPIPSHPDTSVIETTVQSVRERLPDAEIIIMLDGVRSEQEERRQDYEEYQRRLLWKCNHEWTNVLPLRFEEHQHQVAMTRAALKLVKTPAVLFVEHDTPLCEDIPFEGLVSAVEAGAADVVRLHHEALILDDHRYMMLDQEPQDVGGVPMMRTAQWSQRPHVASADFYRRILDDHFGANARTMIEDKMHGVVANAFASRGKAGWQDYKLWIYAPEGDMKRSYHLDGREDDPKYEMNFDG